MTEQQKYIGAFLDGYFEANKNEYGLRYFTELENATELAKKKYKEYKKINKLWCIEKKDQEAKQM